MKLTNYEFLVDHAKVVIASDYLTNAFNLIRAKYPTAKITVLRVIH